MPAKSNSASNPALGLVILGILIALGTFWSFSRGGYDFKVFYFAADLVLKSRGHEIYIHSPDRFLYAPGFAWLLWPFALIPEQIALAFWCFFKALALGLGVRALGAPYGVWAAVFCARPLLIDFQYGQINAIILGLATWILIRYFHRTTRPLPLRAVEWGALGILGATKLVTLPLLLIPWVVGSRPSSKVERWASIFGVLVVILLPLLSISFADWGVLHRQWLEALVAKGLPRESHNQSFAAFLFHFFGSDPTHVIGLGPKPLQLGNGLLSNELILSLAQVWSFAVIGVLLFWIGWAAKRRSPLDYVAVILGLLIVPSHLVWKPYFVFAIPLAAQMIKRCMQTARPQWQPSTLLAAGLFLVFNFASLDFVGPRLNAVLESASVLLWCHLILLFWIATQQTQKEI